MLNSGSNFFSNGIGLLGTGLRSSFNKLRLSLFKLLRRPAPSRPIPLEKNWNKNLTFAVDVIFEDVSQGCQTQIHSGPRISN